MLIVITGLVPALGAPIGRIPTSVAQAMLAGVLLQLCLGPITGAVANPVGVVPVILVWLVGIRFFPRWAVPAAFVVSAVVVVVHAVTTDAEVAFTSVVPRLELVIPEFTAQAIIGLALPLYLVTMASQNVPGVAVMKSLGYDVPWRRAIVFTGVGAAAFGALVTLAPEGVIIAVAGLALFGMFASSL